MRPASSVQQSWLSEPKSAGKLEMPHRIQESRAKYSMNVNKASQKDLVGEPPFFSAILSKRNIIRKQQFGGTQDGGRFIIFMYLPLIECSILRALLIKLIITIFVLVVLIRNVFRGRAALHLVDSSFKANAK